MARIFIKGHKEPLIVNNNVANGVIAILDDNTKNNQSKVVIGNWYGTKEDIKSVLLEEEQEHFDTSEYKNYVKDELEERKRLLQLSKEELAEFNKKFYRMVYTFITGSMNTTSEDEAKERMKEWFEKNPYHTVPNPKCFYDLIPLQEVNRNFEAMLHIVGNIFERDCILAKEDENLLKSY